MLGFGVVGAAGIFTRVGLLAFILPLILGFALFVTGLILLHSWVRCPRCDAALGEVFMARAGPRIKRIRFCPFCAFDLDAPLDVPVISER